MKVISEVLVLVEAPLALSVVSTSDHSKSASFPDLEQN